MTGKFHISSDGQARACRATKVACKLDSDHYDSREEAQAAYEKLNAVNATGGSLQKKSEVNTIPKVNRAINDTHSKLARKEATLKEVGDKALAKIAAGESLGDLQGEYKSLSETVADLAREKKKLLDIKVRLEDQETLLSYKRPSTVTSVRDADNKISDLNQRLKAKKVDLRNINRKIVESARNNIVDQAAVKEFEELEKELEQLSKYRTNMTNRRSKLEAKRRADLAAQPQSYSHSYGGGGCGGRGAC